MCLVGEEVLDTEVGPDPDEEHPGAFLWDAEFACVQHCPGYLVSGHPEADELVDGKVPVVGP